MLRPHEAKERVAKLRDVSEAAGLSVAAVSRYLGGTLSLPPDTAARIDAAVKKLNYRPNPHARSLSRGRSDVIGLVIPDIANPFFARLAAEIEGAVDQQGYGLVLCVTLNRPGREREYIERLRRNYVDGLIFMTNHAGTKGLAQAINDAGKVVLLDEDVEGARTDKIFCENERGGYLAARHLLEAGHRRIAFIGGPKSMLTGRERLAGYRRAIREAGPGAESVAELFGPYSAEFGRIASERLIAEKSPATGIFFGSEEPLLGAFETFSGHGLRAPEDLSVVTFDDVGPLRFLSPPVTAVRQPLAEMGQRAVAAVLRARSDDGQTLVERLPVTLVVRASVSAPSARAIPGARRKRGRAADAILAGSPPDPI
jgi:LacI family transcriptional regulator